MSRQQHGDAIVVLVFGVDAIAVAPSSVVIVPAIVAVLCFFTDTYMFFCFAGGITTAGHDFGFPKPSASPTKLLGRRPHFSIFFARARKQNF